MITPFVAEEMRDILSVGSSSLARPEPGAPKVFMVVGVNGAGKTTTIGKLAARYKAEGYRVILGAGDTFRAAAIDQLAVWADRAGVELIKHQEGSDPAAVAYDAVQAAKAPNADVLILDTAGRLQNKVNLMRELSKVYRVVEREWGAPPDETLLVVDANTGQEWTFPGASIHGGHAAHGGGIDQARQHVEGRHRPCHRRRDRPARKADRRGRGDRRFGDFDADEFVRAVPRVAVGEGTFRLTGCAPSSILVK